jgi:hypothetical protein
MSDLPEKSFMRRHWTDTLFAVAALFVSAVSLWVGIRTEQANEKLVAASTWPYLYVDSSNANPDGSPVIRLDVINSGVGPAKVESFEVFWNGKAWPATDALAGACCGYKPFNIATDAESRKAGILLGAVQGVVIRAGETRAFLTFLLTPETSATWHALDTARSRMSYRICYCSVFDECWIGDFHGIEASATQLHPRRVKICPVPKVPFLQ